MQVEKYAVDGILRSRAYIYIEQYAANKTRTIYLFLENS